MGTSTEQSSIYTAKEIASHRNLLRARLAGVVKPRRLTTHFFWAQGNPDIIKALREGDNEEEETDKTSKKKKAGKRGKRNTGTEAEEDDEEGSERKKTSGLTKYQILVKSEFEKLSQAEQQEWKEMAELDLSEKSERYTAITKGEDSTKTPEFRQQ